MTSVESVPACLLAAVPVVQPPHLEGDPDLATEILPGPPSLLTVQQTGLPRRDHKKTAAAFSYLPVSDPGTTYSGHMATPMATATTTEVDGPRRKRARLDKSSATSRAQRASARNLSAVTTAPEAPSVIPDVLLSASQMIPDSDPLTMPLDSDDPMLSRSNSASNFDDPAPAANGRRSQAPRRDKGKGREKEAPVRVKEEPSAISLQEPIPTLSNEDHCSSCRSLGSLVYCDGCPRAFHLWCLDPPMEASDLPEGEARWFCPACTLRQKQPPKPPASAKFMIPLIEHLQTTIPTEYQLPSDIRTFFKDVATGPRGTYVDNSEIKPPRLNRHGQLEDRDPYRLKDRNGEPVLCFRCGTSALAPGVAAAPPAAKRTRRSYTDVDRSESGRSIISCDYCHLHWHLDCVDPPLAFMPPWGKKWMCPNHAGNILQPKLRIPRNNAQPIEITKPGQVNNGIIEVVQSETVPALQTKVAVDEVLINGRRYRVPERIITMDFWNKAGRTGIQKDFAADESGLSSPLTSLSSLEDLEEIPPVSLAGSYNVEELKAALFLSTLQGRTVQPEKIKVPPLESTHGVPRVDTSVQTDAEKPGAPAPVVALTNGLPKTDSSARQARREKAPARPSRAASAKAPKASTSHRSQATRSLEESVSNEQHGGLPSEVAEPIPVVASTSRRNRRSVVETPLASASSQLQMIAAQEVQEAVAALSLQSKAEPAPTNAVPARPKRARQPPRGRLSPVTITTPAALPRGGGETDDTATANAASSGAESTTRIKLNPPGSAKKRAASRSRVRASKPVTPAPTAEKVGDMPAPTTAPGPSTLKAESTPSTSLKIRLPRLGSIHPSPSAPPPPTHEPAAASAPSRTKAQGSAAARNRRSLRGQTSSSLNGTPLSSIEPGLSST